MTETQREFVQQAMKTLERMPMGLVGQEGPTIEEMDAHLDEADRPWANDATYHESQYAWRLLECALKA